MTRSAAILLAFVLAIASGVAVCFGYFQKTQANQTVALEVSCEDVMNKKLTEAGKLILTEYQHGKHVVGFDDNGDGKWECVYLPLFPKSMKKLGPTYHAVVAHLDKVETKDQLKELLDSGQISLRYDTYAQSLNERTYNRMAQKYPSMNFKQNVLLTSKPSMEYDLPKVLILGGGIGFVLSLLLGGICAFMAMLDFLKTRIAKDDEKFSSANAKSNRAGLPASKKAAPPAAPTATAGGTELQSQRFLNK